MAFMVRSEGHKKSHLEAYAGYKAPKKDSPFAHIAIFMGISLTNASMVSSWL